MELLSIVGARPQFIKAAEVHRALAALGAQHGILHTGQHYDHALSKVFFDELGMPRPMADLGIGSGAHGLQTARMLEGIERVLVENSPRAVVLYGDTNSTLAGALAAAKLRIPIAHVEAGLRSHDRSMPEEVNRVLCDHCSTWLFCPTETAMRNLAREGMAEHEGPPSADRPTAVLTGDVMFDSILHHGKEAASRSSVMQQLGLRPDGFLLATVHRDFNTDRMERLGAILSTLEGCGRAHTIPVVLPLHPRTRAALTKWGIDQAGWRWLRVIDPVGYLDMLALERGTRLILTDSGGVQKEAYFHGKPCIVLRPATEWTELVEHGQAVLADADPERIAGAVSALLHSGIPACPGLYGDGHAAEHIARILA